MNRNTGSRTFRILALATMFMLMMLLCGCRTRITNNTEVTSALSDESGMLQESYQARRDELGISVAEAPLFDVNNGEDEEYDGEYDEDWDEEYDSEEEYDDEEEDDDDTGAPAGNTVTRRPTSTTTTTGNRRQSNVIVRRPSTTTTTGYRVTLNANGKGAKCSRSYLIVRKGAVYGALPTPTRSGYKFKGWFTDKTKGSQVTSSTRVTSDKAHTLYAHWEKTTTTVKTYTVTFDGNGDGDDVELSGSEITVEESGTYGDLPTAKRDKYSFKGWFTEADGGDQITSGTKFSGTSDQTLYAHWEEDYYNWWKNEFSIAANEITETVDVQIVGGGDSLEKKLVGSCKGNVVKEETDYSIILEFLEDYDYDKAVEEAERLYEKTTGGSGSEEEGSEVMADPTIIIISDDAISGDDDQKLIYKIMLLDALHGGTSGIDIEEVESDLEARVYDLCIYPQE